MAIFMPVHPYLEVENFLQYLRFEKKYSQHTVTSYSIDLNQFFTYLFTEYDSPSLPEIKTPLLRSWLAELKSKDDLTNKSINRKISALKSFFKYMLKLGKIELLPTAGIISPKTGKRLPVFINEKDIAKIFDDIEFPDDHDGRTEKLVLALFYNTGMRLSELINLKISDVDYGYQTIKVLGKGNKERIIPVSAKLLENVKYYVENKPCKDVAPTLVFTNGKGKCFNPKIIYNFVKKYLGEATTLEKKSPHILRHTFATHLMNNGAEMNAVKELLGHASLASTQVYTHLTIEKLKEVYRQAHPKA